MLFVCSRSFWLRIIGERMPLDTIISTVKQEKDRKKSLYYSILDAMAVSVMVGFGDRLISAFAVALKASSTEIGLLVTLPPFLGSLTQLYGARLVDIYNNRLKVVLPFVLLHAFFWLPIALIPFLFPHNAVTALIILYSLAMISTAISIPAWTSMMGDIVWLKQRGKYFGKRNSLAAAILLPAVAFAGYFLTLYPPELLFIGFAASFFIAFLFRFVSYFFIRRMHEPLQVFAKQPQPSFFQFMKKIRSNNYGNLVALVGGIRFANYFAGPFFAPYMLIELGFSYFQFTLVFAAAMAAQVIFMTIWGKRADRFGNVKVLALTSILVSSIPIWWILTRDFYLILLINAFAGMAWAGFSLSAGNFLYDAVDTPNRARYTAYNNIVDSSMALAGSIVGGLYLTFIASPWIFTSVYHVVFFASGVGRFVFSSLLIPGVKEVRDVPPIKKRTLFFSLFEFSPNEFVEDQAFQLVLLKKKFYRLVDKNPAFKKKVKRMKNL
jgi:MFS family permease